MKNLFVLLIFFQILIISKAYSEESYKWKDENGITFYGSKPPPNAKEVQKFSTRKISKYSSKSAFGQSSSANSKNEKTSEIVEDTGKGEVYKDSRIGPPVKKPASRSSVRSVSSNKLKLVSKTPLLKINKEGEITSCEVSVTNEDDVGANDVSVAFEFFDGTLIPASGAFKIAPGKTETYNIPDTLLPLVFSVGDMPIEDTIVPAPKVIIHASMF